MQIDYQFMPAGSTVTACQGVVYLDLGNDLCPGIIDNHTDKGGVLCASQLTLKHPEYVSQMIDPAVPFVITVHHAPDFDAILAAYFATKIARQQSLTAMDQALANLADELDAGGLPLAALGERNALLYFSFLEGVDASILAAGFALLDYLCQPDHSVAELHSGALFGQGHPFTFLQERIAEDEQRYQGDRERATVITMSLAARAGGEIQPVDGLIIERPEAKLFKHWARNDCSTSPAGRGFAFLVVEHSGPRFVISVDPSTDLSLEGLGASLEAAEQARRKQSGQPRVGRPRPGYGVPDPWYDGRAPIHGYTIVDTPSTGTVLGRQEILNLVLDVATWQREG